MPDQESKHTVRKIVLSIVAILITLIIILGFSGYHYYTSSLEPLDPNSTEEIPVEIPIGSSRTDIARILEEKGVINSAFVFNYHLRFNGEEGFQAGHYIFSPALSSDEIVQSLKEGGSPITEESTGSLTIPEGYTIEQIANVIEDETDYSQDEFFELVQSEEFLQEKRDEFPKLLDNAYQVREETLYTLEGYLYPATYEFYEDTTLEDLVTQMLSRMDQTMQAYYAEIETQESSVHDILTMAAYIEREGVTAEDRKLISGVFYNRLAVGMPLQTDISVIYALGEHKEQITYDDLEVNSPYNLYQHTGLGPGPVNSSSEDSIYASVYPAETDYMYFIAELSTQKVYFSETYEQHLELKAELN